MKPYVASQLTFCFQISAGSLQCDSLTVSFITEQTFELLEILCAGNSSFESRVEVLLFNESSAFRRIGIRHPKFRLHGFLLRRFLSTALSARVLSGVSLIQRSRVSFSRLFDTGVLRTGSGLCSWDVKMYVACGYFPQPQVYLLL